MLEKGEEEEGEASSNARWLTRPPAWLPPSRPSGPANQAGSQSVSQSVRQAGRQPGKKEMVVECAAVSRCRRRCRRSHDGSLRQSKGQFYFYYFAAFLNARLCERNNRLWFLLLGFLSL